MNELNKYFSIDQAIGKEITENEFHVLLTAKRLWVTKCQFANHYEAHRAIGGEIEDFNADGHQVYGGMLLTESPEDFEEAARIAGERGWGETVEGVLYGVIPYESKTINPCDTSNQIN
jgi:hypothetical protein